MQPSGKTKKKFRRERKRNSMNQAPSSPSSCEGAYGCPMPIFCKGLCRSHYMQEWYAAGIKGGKRQCQYPLATGFQGLCGKKVHRSALCSTHWKRAPTCKDEGCRRKVLVPGARCPKHARLYTASLRRRKGQKRADECSVGKCNLSVICRGLCRQHYDRRRWERRGDPVQRRTKLQEDSVRRDQEQGDGYMYLFPGAGGGQEGKEGETACLRYVFMSTLRSPFRGTTQEEGVKQT